MLEVKRVLGTDLRRKVERAYKAKIQVEKKQLESDRDAA